MKRRSQKLKQILSEVLQLLDEVAVRLQHDELFVREAIALDIPAMVLAAQLLLHVHLASTVLAVIAGPDFT